MTDLSFPESLRYRHPLPPRDVPVVAEEPHCPRDCVHLSESWRAGYVAGRRDERERGGEGFPARWAFWVGAAVTSLLWIAAAGLGR
jgi:hypothetical protein